MSIALRKRLVTYFQGGAAIRKECRIAGDTDRLVWEVVGHELAAQLRELELIRRHQPRFNVKGRQPDRPLGYIYISREDAPRVRTGASSAEGRALFVGAACHQLADQGSARSCQSIFQIERLPGVGADAFCRSRKPVLARPAARMSATRDGNLPWSVCRAMHARSVHGPIASRPGVSRWPQCGSSQRLNVICKMQRRTANTNEPPAFAIGWNDCDICTIDSNCFASRPCRRNSSIRSMLAGGKCGICWPMAALSRACLLQRPLSTPAFASRGCSKCIDQLAVEKSRPIGRLAKSFHGGFARAVMTSSRFYCPRRRKNSVFGCRRIKLQQLVSSAKLRHGSVVTCKRSTNHRCGSCGKRRSVTVFSSRRCFSLRQNPGRNQVGTRRRFSSLREASVAWRLRRTIPTFPNPFVRSTRA